MIYVIIILDIQKLKRKTLRKLMEKNSTLNLINLQNEEDRKMALDQYKMILESLNKINDIREMSNNFWIAINIALIGTIAYVRDAGRMEDIQKYSFAFTIIFLGFCMSICWISYLLTIKKRINLRNNMLVQLEKQLPVKFITVAVSKEWRKMRGGSLSYKEMTIPILFLTGYILFAILIYIYPIIFTMIDEMN